MARVLCSSVVLLTSIFLQIRASCLLMRQAQAALNCMGDDEGGPMSVEVRIDNQGVVSVYRV